MPHVCASTKRLDLDDSHLFRFSARVMTHSSYDSRPTIVLDQTAFYPESGGQLADRGTLGSATIVDVQIDEGGTLHHVIDGPLPALGETVACAIDVPRRRQHMAQHTGQHLLSWALTELAHAPTRSSHLGESACTIDVDQPSLSATQLTRVADTVNEVIEANHEVRTFYPSPDELAQLPLRRRPKVDENIRVVAIGDFEHVPCGGTHVARTSEIRLITILSAEHYKGLTRVTFAAGERARKLLEARSQTLADLGRALTSGPLEVPDAVERLRADLGEAERRLAATRKSLAAITAERLLESTPSVLVTAALPNADRELLREVGKRITAVAGRVALLAAPSPEGTPVFAARAEGADFDCGAFLKQLTAAVGGRGGGRPAHAEGQLTPDIDWDKAVRDII